MKFYTNETQATSLLPANTLIRLTAMESEIKEVTFVTFAYFMANYASGTNWMYYARIFADNNVTSKLDWYCGYSTAERVQ